MKWTLEQLTGALKRAGINPDGHGERIGETREEHVRRILDQCDIAVAVEHDKRVNWPRIEAEQEAAIVAGFIPVQDGVREEL